MRFSITIEGRIGPLTGARLAALGYQTDGGCRIAGEARDQADLLEVLRALHGLGLAITDVHCDGPSAPWFDETGR
jgi:hypothetical protein